jgi:exonuclease SbcC
VKPLHLTIQAFGPFADEQVLDFKDLAGHDFFLIHGPTGAGKTSILDAMSFALYGETSGGLREPRDMRSHFADPSLSTRVVFEFELGEKIYRVERSPEQQVPRQKGGGFKKQSAIANLWEIRGGKAQPLATEKPSAVDAKVVELMGFKAGQFRQVVVLPQGQFQEFLLASSTERQAILQVLFQTGRYAEITEALAAGAQTLKDEIRGLLAESRQLLEQAGVPDRAELTAKLEGLDRSLAALREKRQIQETARDAAMNALQEGRRVQAMVEERDEAVRALESLRLRIPEIEAQKHRLERARRADQVAPFLLALKEAEGQVARLGEEAQTLAQEAREKEAALEQARLAQDQAERQESRREELRRTIVRLKELEPQLQLLDKAREEMRSAGRERLNLEADLQRLQRRLEKLGTDLAEYHARHLARQAEAGRADALEFQLQQDKKLRRNREEADRIQAELRLAEAEFKATEETRRARETEFQAARQNLELLRRHWESGQAAFLAEALKHSGGPCPVCGSKSHPHLATPPGSLPTEVELKTAQERFQQAEYLLNRATVTTHQRITDQEKLKSRLETFLETLGDHASLSSETLAAHETEHRQALEIARQAQAELPFLSEKIRSTEDERVKGEASLKELQAQCSATQGREASARGAVEALQGSLLAELRAPGALSTRLGQATESLEALERQLAEARQFRESAASAALEARTRLESQQRQLEEAARTAGQRSTALDQALADGRFRDASDFESARRNPEAQADLEAEVRLHGEGMAAAEARHQRALEAAEDRVAPDLARLEADLNTSQSALATTDEELGRGMADRETLDRTARTLDDKQQESAGKERRWGLLGRLAKVARGEEGAKVSFERFVQGAILDEVLASASMRLMHMSRNRYSLRRAAGTTDLRRGGGLDLEVPDAHTGRARAASTLSGGEGFQASLALALGLSDVVQRHAGGVKLNTVFVDEGFGSLDAEALDLALETLNELKHGGRLVGIISHLDEVKQRIPARLELMPTPSGSRAAFRFV